MQTRSEETRTSILQSAIQLFSKSGYDATSVADICRYAGVSKGAFYYHFPSKQAVFQALLEDWLKLLETQFDAILTTAPDVTSGLIGLAAMTRSIFHDAGDQLPMFLEFWIHSSRDPRLWQTAIAPYRHFLDLFASRIADASAQGHLKPGDPQVAGQAFMALAIGVILQGLMDPHGAQWDEVAQQGIRYLLAGMAAPAADHPA